MNFASGPLAASQHARHIASRIAIVTSCRRPPAFSGRIRVPGRIRCIRVPQILPQALILPANPDSVRDAGSRVAHWYQMCLRVPKDLGRSGLRGSSGGLWTPGSSAKPGSSALILDLGSVAVAPRTRERRAGRTRGLDASSGAWTRTRTNPAPKAGALPITLRRSVNTWCRGTS